MSSTTSTGAKKILGTDDWRDIFSIHNDTVDAYDGIIGTDSMGTTATTVKGAIAEHEGDINGANGINAKIGNTAMGTTATTITGAVKELNDQIAKMFNNKFPIVGYVDVSTIANNHYNEGTVNFSSFMPNGLSFASVPYIVASLTQTTDPTLFSLITKEVSKTSVTFRVANTSSSNGTVKVEFIAVGSL